MASVLLARGRHAELASVLRVQVEPQQGVGEEGTFVGPPSDRTAVQLVRAGYEIGPVIS